MSADAPDAARRMFDGYSLEAGAGDMSALATAAPRIAPDTTIAVPHLPARHEDARLTAMRTVRGLGFTPMPHLSARRFTSRSGLETFVERAVGDAGVDRCLVIAGDPSTPMGPFPDSLSLIETGVFERAGIRMIAVGGHPQAHPVMQADERWTVLERKCRSIEARGMSPVIVTQFAFDADAVLTWLDALRDRGFPYPVRIGVAGPASVPTLVRYAATCGVDASASMLARYGVSIGKLFHASGPDRFVDCFAARLTGAHGEVRLHIHPFGGLERSVEWIAGSRRRMRERASRAG